MIKLFSCLTNGFFGSKKLGNAQQKFCDFNTEMTVQISTR